MAEPEARAGAAALPLEHLAALVDQRRGAGHEGLEQDDAEALEARRVAEDARAGHRLALLRLGEHAGVDDEGMRVDGPAAGHHEPDVAAGALAEDADVLGQHRDALRGLAPAAVEDVGGVDPAARGEGGGVGVERLDPHADHAAARLRQAADARGKVALGLGVEQAAADGAEHLADERHVGEGLVVEARNEQGPLGPHARGADGEAEEVGAGEDAVVVRRAQVVVEGAAVDAVGEPRLLLRARELRAAPHRLLVFEEDAGIAVVDWEVLDLERAVAHDAGRPLVGPGEMARRAGGQQPHPEAAPRASQGELAQQGLGAAGGGPVGMARHDDGDGGDGAHVIRPASRLRRRAVRVRRGAPRGGGSSRRTARRSPRARRRACC